MIYKRLPGSGKICLAGGITAGLWVFIRGKGKKEKIEKGRRKR
jgi:hypothetical protein